MSLLRQSAYRSLTTVRLARVSPRAFSVQTARHQGYGDPHGSPASSNPQEQGKNPQVDKEHPGPDAPSAAKKSSGSSSNSSDKKDTATSSKSSKQAKNGARPAIHDQSEPDNSAEEVKRHNEELAQRNEKQHEKDSGEKVDPKFWKGHADDKPK